MRLRVLGAEAGDRLGSAVGGGFFNKGDTIPDLAGVAPLAGGSSRKTAGKAYLIKGKK